MRLVCSGKAGAPLCNGTDAVQLASSPCPAATADVHTTHFQPSSQQIKLALGALCHHAQAVIMQQEFACCTCSVWAPFNTASHHPLTQQSANKTIVRYFPPFSLHIITAVF